MKAPEQRAFRGQHGIPDMRIHAGKRHSSAHYGILKEQAADDAA
jgi:hypothetical protein